MVDDGAAGTGAVAEGDGAHEPCASRPVPPAIIVVLHKRGRGSITASLPPLPPPPPHPLPPSFIPSAKLHYSRKQASPRSQSTPLR